MKGLGDDNLPIFLGDSNIITVFRSKIQKKEKKISEIITFLKVKELSAKFAIVLSDNSLITIIVENSHENRPYH